jgi:hypothetical protein
MTEGSVLDRSLTARPTVSRKLPGEELAENPALFKSRVVELVNTAGFEPAALGLYVRVVPLLPHPSLAICGAFLLPAQGDRHVR